MNKAAMAVSTFVEGYLWPQAPKENYGEAHFGESHPPREQSQELHSRPCKHWEVPET
jgi:hypothetical protein